jgi:WD40 repeat protein
MMHSVFRWLGRPPERRMLIRLTSVLMPPLVLLSLMGFLGLLLPGGREEESASIILGEHCYPVHCIGFAPDGKTLASGGGFPGKDGEVCLWDVPSGNVRVKLQGHQKCVYAATFSADGRTLATTSYDGVVKLLDVASARERASLAMAAEYSGLPVAVSANGNMLALASCRPGLVLPGCEANEVMLWRAAQRERAGRRTADSNQETNGKAPGFVPVAIGGDNQGLALCRVNLRPQSQTAHAPALRRGLETTPQLRGLVSGTASACRYWDVTIGQQSFTLRGHEDFIHGLAFSPNGRTLASASSDQTVRLWDAFRGQVRAILPGHTAQVNGVAFSVDGTLLASGSHDRTVRLWETSTGCELATFCGHEGAVTCVAFSRDGRFVASGSYDKSVRLWRVIHDQ